jgi:hypothetical protein
MSRPSEGTGGWTVAIDDQPHKSWKIRIGKELYRKLEAPEYMIVERVGGRLTIRPADAWERGYYTINWGVSLQPCFSVGRPQGTALELRGGVYEAEIRDEVIHIHESLR